MFLVHRRLFGCRIQRFFTRESKTVEQSFDGSAAVPVGNEQRRGAIRRLYRDVVPRAVAKEEASDVLTNG